MINKKNRGYFKIYVGAVLFAAAFLLSSVLKAEEITSKEELKSLASQLKIAEKKILNIKIDSQAWEEKRYANGQWEKTPICVSSTAWYDGLPASKMRIDVHKEILKWEQGAAPYLEDSYSVSFNGQYGRIVRHTSGYNDVKAYQEEAEILPEVPNAIDRWQYGTTGIIASLNYALIGKDWTFSETLSIAADANAELHSNVLKYCKFSRERFNDANCLRISIHDMDNYWFDLQKGFALLGYDGYTRNKKLMDSMRVTRLEKVTNEIWYPFEACFTSYSMDPNKPDRKLIWKASSVIINDPNITDEVYTSKIPEDYLVDDKVSGEMYRIKAGKKEIVNPEEEMRRPLKKR
jgi:hypothetical protein